MLLEKQKPHFLTRLGVHIFAIMCLVAGSVLLVASLVEFALGAGLIEKVFFAAWLLLGATLLVRLRSRGLWLLALLVLGLYVRLIFQDTGDFWPQFFFNLVALLALCVIFPSYFALRRGEGRRPAPWVYFFISLLYIILTSLSFAAYYDDGFCDYKQTALMPSDHIELSLRLSLHVSFRSSFAQWLAFVPCYADGNFSHE